MPPQSTIEAPESGRADGAALAPVPGARLLRRALRQAEGQPGEVLRLSVSVPPTDPLAWLAGQRSPFRCFWRGRDDADAWAAAGVAEEIEGPDALARLESRLAALPEHSQARYVGGLPFDGPGGGDDWGPFGAPRFVLPRFELRVSDSEAVLSTNLMRSANGPARREEILKELASPRAFADRLPVPVAREDLPSRPTWRRSVVEALEAIRRGDLDKVVLARRARVRFDAFLDPFALFRRLQEATPSCFHFLIQFGERHTLIGASPERLFCWHDGRVETEAVAGTRPRGSDPQADARLVEELASSAKDAREHQFVVDHLRAALRAMARRVRVQETEVLALASAYHLRTRLSAQAATGAGPLALLERLHPTPAVGGTPTGAALARIRAAEPFDRGWYAGPVGWAGARQADFAVAIRCGLLRAASAGAVLDLFAGAGIVAGSDPSAECCEVEDKLSDFRRVLGLED